VPAGVPTRSAHSVRIADEKPGKPRLTARWRGRKSPPAETLTFQRGGGREERGRAKAASYSRGTGEHNILSTMPIRENDPQD